MRATPESLYSQHVPLISLRRICCAEPDSVIQTLHNTDSLPGDTFLRRDKFAKSASLHSIRSVWHGCYRICSASARCADARKPARLALAESGLLHCPHGVCAKEIHRGGLPRNRCGQTVFVNPTLARTGSEIVLFLDGFAGKGCEA